MTITLSTLQSLVATHLLDLQPALSPIRSHEYRIIIFAIYSHMRSLIAASGLSYPDKEGIWNNQYIQILDTYTRTHTTHTHTFIHTCTYTHFFSISISLCGHTRKWLISWASREGFAFVWLARSDKTSIVFDSILVFQPRKKIREKAFQFRFHLLFLFWLFQKWRHAYFEHLSQPIKC